MTVSSADSRYLLGVFRYSESRLTDVMFALASSIANRMTASSFTSQACLNFTKSIGTFLKPIASRPLMSCKSSKNFQGEAVFNAFSSSLKTLSGVSSCKFPALIMSAMSAIVSLETSKPRWLKRAKNRATRSTRSGSSEKAGDTCVSFFALRSETPPTKSTIFPA